MAGRPLRRNGAHGTFLLEPSENRTIEERMYWAGEHGEHGVANYDRPGSYWGDAPAGYRVEEVSLQQEMKDLISFANTLNTALVQHIRPPLEAIAHAHKAEFSARAKTPHSLINKMRRKALVLKVSERMPKISTLTDLIGCRYTVTGPNVRSRIRRIRQDIVAWCNTKTYNEPGSVRLNRRASADYYRTPMKGSGYRGLHLILRVAERNEVGELVHFFIEVQIRGACVSETADNTHTAYKSGAGGSTDTVFRLAERADETGDAQDIDAWRDAFHRMTGRWPAFDVSKVRRVNGRIRKNGMPNLGPWEPLHHRAPVPHDTGARQMWQRRPLEARSYDLPVASIHERQDGTASWDVTPQGRVVANGVEGSFRQAARAADDVLARLGYWLAPSVPTRTNGSSRPRAQTPTLVQSILFDRAVWTPTSARDWLASHGYRGSNRDMDITERHIRVRQIEPGRCDRNSFRTGWLSKSKGIQAVFARRK